MVKLFTILPLQQNYKTTKKYKTTKLQKITQKLQKSTQKLQKKFHFSFKGWKCISKFN